ncbi:hypothetical protein AVEN_263500-1 [Araneus ventricosus]|uniref:Retrotransposon gag domain-containing protein n=1 Tax=Araneus ventricosus TaxID=182803 RepID=A0A4Y2EXR3_ARAVE|nr:hypothetical protein AVEN_263500-1 [Araneus ventricosus]
MALPQSLSMEPFNAEVETFALYLDQLEMFFTTNNVTDDKKPKDKSFQELTTILEKQLNPKPLVISERFRFHKRNQTEGECVEDFCAQLKKLSTNCEFGQFLDDNLPDRFVCGLRSEAIQKKLLSEADLTHEKAVNIGIAMETAARDTVELHIMCDSKSLHKGNQARNSTKCSCDCQQNRELKPVRDKTRRTFRSRCFRCSSLLHFADVALTVSLTTKKSI